MNSINQKQEKSQWPRGTPSLFDEYDLADEELENEFRSILPSRHIRDLFLLEYILKVFIVEKRGVSVEEAMKIVGMSNAATSIRLRTMRETKIGNTGKTLLASIKKGNAFFHYPTKLINSEKALQIVQDILVQKNISYEDYLASQGLSNSDQEDEESDKDIESLADSSSNIDPPDDFNNSIFVSENIVHQIEQAPSTTREILEIIGPSGITAKLACSKVGCTSSTANKHLKDCFDKGWLTRIKDATDNGQYIYYLSDELSNVLNPNNKVQHTYIEENLVENQNLPNSTSQIEDINLSQMREWANLNRQIKEATRKREELEQDLIARNGKQYGEMLRDIKTTMFL